MFTNMIELIFIVTSIILILIVAFLVNLSLASRRLKKEHEFTSKVLDTTSALILVLSNDGKILHCNRAYSSLAGFKTGELFENRLETPSLINAANDFPETRILHQFEESMIGKDGQRRTISWSRGRIRDIHGNVQWILTGIDITEQKKAYEKLRAHRTQLRALSSELSLSEERERRRIAGELHDRIGQYLSLAKLKLGELQEIELSTGLANIVKHIDELISQTIQDTRTLIFEISPPILQELGFIAAINWLAEKISKQHDIEVLVENDTKNPLLIDENMRMILYRAVRELLINIVKHSQAKQAKVSIRMDNSHLYVNVEDDGVGFDSARGDSNNGSRDYLGGFGLFNVRENITHHKGYFTIESELDCGTLAKIRVPLMEARNKKNLEKA